MTVHVLSMRDPAPAGAMVIDTTTRSQTWSRGLSPMIVRWHDMLVENVWQYTKVYPQHWDAEAGMPTEDWFAWNDVGLASNWGERYPMGKGVRPVCSWWQGRAFDYVPARKAIYLPVYAQAVQTTEAFARLRATYEAEGEVWLRDFDGYDHRALGMSLDDVLNDPTRKMGHAFVLAAMLEMT